MSAWVASRQLCADITANCTVQSAWIADNPQLQCFKGTRKTAIPYHRTNTLNICLLPLNSNIPVFLLSGPNVEYEAGHLDHVRELSFPQVF